MERTNSLLVPKSRYLNWKRKVEIQGQEMLVGLTTVDSWARPHTHTNC